MTTFYCYRVGIMVHVMPPTNTRGTRLRVYRSDCTYADDPDRLTVAWDHGLNGSDNACAAVDQYLARKDASWQGAWVVASATQTVWHATYIDYVLPELDTERGIR